MFVGADGESQNLAESVHPAWRTKFRAVELVVHYKWQMERTRGRKTLRRDDYDIALVRLDYPAIDQENGNSLNCLIVTL